MKIQESGEMYLESIYLIQKEHGNVRSVDVANFTGYSKPSVSRAVGLLKSADLISVADDGVLTLTPKGLHIAERTYERHTVLTEFFKRLGVPDDVASNDACKIEHVISDTSFCAFKDFLKKLK